MARPRDLDKRRDLARRAVGILEARGLALPAEQLARALGVNRTTLLYHFPTYAEIIHLALVELLAEQAAYVEAAVAEHTHPVDRIYARVRAVHAFHEGRERRLLFLSQAVAVTGGDRVAEVVRSAADLFAASRRALAEDLERGIAEGTVAPCDAKALVALVRSVIDGLTIQRVTEGGSVEAAHRFLWSHVLAPLKRKPVRPRVPAQNARRAPRARARHTH